MATLHLLGTGAAFSDASRTTTMLAVANPTSTLVVDCGGDVVQRLLAHDIALDTIEALIVTHEHADHVAGFPLMMERLWLAGRRRPLDVYGIHPALAQARRIHDAFDTTGWPGYPAIRYHPVEQREGARVLERDAWKVAAAPGDHSVPVVGLRIDDRRGGGVMAYSCDTQYSPVIERMAQGADVLVHEATGGGPGHATADDAGRVAAAAGVRRLVLVHIAPHGDEGGRLASEARARFPEASVGSDGDRISF